MNASVQPSVDLDALGIAGRALERLRARARREVDRAGLGSAQIAVARHGKLVCCDTFGAGEARSEPPTYVAFSTSKAVVASAVWLAIQDGLIDPCQPVTDAIPCWAGTDKASITLEHLLTHTCGFPKAYLEPESWGTPATREAFFREITLESEPGERFEYHATASYWAVVAVLEHATGEGFREFVDRRVFQALGLQDAWLGLPAEQNDRVMPVHWVGGGPPRWLLRMLGLKVPARFTSETYYEAFNQPSLRAIGVPSSGMVCTAGALAMFYQALLGHIPSPWDDATVTDGLRIRTGDLVDPMTGKLANRCLGMVVAGDTHRRYRAFGSRCSPTAFGHPGAGGQIAWADPRTGLSFVFLTSGFDRHTLRMGMRGGALSNLAVRCVVDREAE